MKHMYLMGHAHEDGRSPAAPDLNLLDAFNFVPRLFEILGINSYDAFGWKTLVGTRCVCVRILVVIHECKAYKAPNTFNVDQTYINLYVFNKPLQNALNSASLQARFHNSTDKNIKGEKA